MSIEEEYKQITKKIMQLPSKGEANLWIKAMLPQVQDLVKRAVSDKCRERRYEKLAYYWKIYQEKAK